MSKQTEYPPRLHQFRRAAYRTAVRAIRTALKRAGLVESRTLHDGGFVISGGLNPDHTLIVQFDDRHADEHSPPPELRDKYKRALWALVNEWVSCGDPALETQGHPRLVIDYADCPDPDAAEARAYADAMRPEPGVPTLEWL